MPLDSAEGIEDALKAIGIGQKILDIASGMPPVTPDRPRKFADFKPILDVVGSDVLPLVDQVVEDIAD